MKGSRRRNSLLKRLFKASVYTLGVICAGLAWIQCFQSLVFGWKEKNKKNDDDGIGGRQCVKHERCVFVVSLGRSGSTALQDALNQMPGVYIRGENHNMFQMLYNLEQVALQNSMPEYETAEDRMGLKRTPLDEKRDYETFVLHGNKPAWYSLFEAGAADCAKASFFKHLYGYGGFQSYIVGFKEVRHADDLFRLLNLEDVNPWIFPKYSNGMVYKTYETYLNWMRGLCTNTKIVFNMRREYDFSQGQGFYLGKGFELKRNVEWMYRYMESHKDASHLVYYEDMFDPSKNKTVLENVAAFVGIRKRDIPKGVSFARLPRSRR